MASVGSTRTPGALLPLLCLSRTDVGAAVHGHTHKTDRAASAQVDRLPNDDAARLCALVGRTFRHGASLQTDFGTDYLTHKGAAVA